MRDHRFAAQAVTDLRQLLGTSERRWGKATRQRYDRLIQHAVRQVRSAPTGPLSRRYPAISSVYSYHLRHSRRQAGQIVVREPTHLLFYSIEEDGSIVILRVLHERSEFSIHLHDQA